MDSAFAVESKPLITDIPEFEKLLSSDPSLIEIIDLLYIYKDEKSAASAKELLEEAELFEGLHPLIFLDNGRAGENFFDYGFKGEKGVYLFKDLLIAFYLVGDDPAQIKMATLQIEEHLVFAATHTAHELLFVEFHLSSLINGIATAYECVPRFLVLDK